LALPGLGCSGSSAQPGGEAGSAGAPPIEAGIPFVDSDVPFTPPDGLAPDITYVPVPGTCGFDAPAFCDTFESGPMAGGRSGELDPAHWSVTRGGPWAHASLDEAFGIGPALIPPCRAGLPEMVLPDSDVLICDPSAAIHTRHLLTVTAAQNYGLNAYRIRQPFDFAGRTGTIKLDVDLTNNALDGWPAVVLSDDPAQAPSFDWEERGSGPRNGLEIEWNRNSCGAPRSVRPQVYTFHDYLQTSPPETDGCGDPQVTGAPDSLNHVEIYLTQTHLEVWSSDASPDGVTFHNLQRVYAGDIALPFTRGYVSLVVRNHASLKYWGGSAWITRWDNVGFDGPVVSNWREYSAPDSLTVTHGLPGCLVGACQWRGRTIADHPGDDSVCKDSCDLDGEGRNVGYVVPNADEPPVKIELPDVRIEGVTRARLALAATYPYFEWSGKFPPATELNLRHRLNGGPWHDRFITPEEVNAFQDYFPELGGAGAGAGLLNQTIELDAAELRDGTNVVELSGAGTWTGSYRMGVTGVDLVLATAP
jgi:hypothetical protein